MPNPKDIESGIAQAVRFFRGSTEPHALLWLALIHRRFGVPEFADALSRFDGMVAASPERAASLRVFRRLADPAHRLDPEDLQAVTHPSDLIVVYALYADQQPLPPVFSKALMRAAAEGGYFLTHALLAWVWARDNASEPELPEGFIDELCRANAAIVNADTGIVSDLRLEAAAFLQLAGRGELVDESFFDTVLVTQNDDGGWGLSRDAGGASDWHATILALLLLLERRAPANSACLD